MKNRIMISLLAVTGFTAPAIAAVDLDTFRFECPNASGGTPSERLTNYGTYIRGMGESNIGANKILAIFHGIPGAGVPLDLSTGGYTHAGTQYNPSTGRVTCLYKSSSLLTNAIISNDPFDVSYVTANIKHGWVVKSDNSSISIKVLVG